MCHLDDQKSTSDSINTIFTCTNRISPLIELSDLHTYTYYSISQKYSFLFTYQTKSIPGHTLQQGAPGLPKHITQNLPNILVSIIMIEETVHAIEILHWVPPYIFRLIRLGFVHFYSNFVNTFVLIWDKWSKAKNSAI